MTERDELRFEQLRRLSELRENYKAEVKAIDEDLANERRKRIAVAQGTIVHLIIEAYVAGASINAIKRAYNTKDFNTIKNIINSNEALIEQLRTQKVVEEKRESEWFEVEATGEKVLILGERGSTGFIVVPLGDEFMLDAINTPEPDLTYFDGAVVNEDHYGDLFEAIKVARGDA